MKSRLPPVPQSSSIRSRRIADRFERCLIGVGEPMHTGAMLPVEEGSCERGRLRAPHAKRIRNIARAHHLQTSEQLTNHGCPFGNAARLSPEFCEALFVDFEGRGRVCLSLQIFAITSSASRAFVGSRRCSIIRVAAVEALRNLVGDEPLKFFERFSRPVAGGILTVFLTWVFWADLLIDNPCVLPTRLSSASSPPQTRSCTRRSNIRPRSGGILRLRGGVKPGYFRG
jgi:hypothetical protein